jgi:catechol 2,3-dioxygenase-like lactoylglutathione lyase family enzyme
MNQEESLTTIGQPVPELPVADVEKAQHYYRDVLGFEIGWLYPRSSDRQVRRSWSRWRKSRGV